MSREYPNNHGRSSGAQVRSSKADIGKQVPALEATPLLGNGSSLPEEHPWEGDADFADLPWWKKPSIFWLLPPFFLFALAFGGIIVPKLNLILSLICKDYLADKVKSDPSYILIPVILDADNPQCRIPEVQSLATQFMLYITITTGIMSAIMSPKLGAWSDRYGRTRFLALSSVGLFMSEVVTILAAKFPEQIHYQWLLVGAVFDGLFGSFTASMAITFAYVSDCTPPHKRAVSFSYFHACLFGGIALGPLVAAFVLQLTGKLLSLFYVMLCVHVFYISFILFIVPESLVRKRQEMAQQNYATKLDLTSLDGQTLLTPLWRLLAPLKILWPTGPETSARLRANLSLLAAVDTIIFGIAMGGMTVIVYYLGYEFGWDSKQTSLFMSSVSTTRVAGLLILLPFLTYCFRTRRRNAKRRASGVNVPERHTGSDTFELVFVRSAIAIEVIGYAGYAMARRGSLFCLFGILAAIGGIGSPTLQGALTKHVPSDKVGQLFGATGLLHALARIVAPAVSNFIYAKTVKVFPQTIFVVLSGCFGVAFVCSLFIRPNVTLDEPRSRPPTAASQSERDAEADLIVDEEIAAI